MKLTDDQITQAAMKYCEIEDISPYSSFHDWFTRTNIEVVRGDLITKMKDKNFSPSGSWKKAIEHAIDSEVATDDQSS